MVDEIMNEADLSPAQLDAVAFGRGPGAFTGVRIATSVAQGIAFGADLPVAPISTLATLAQAGHRQHGYQDMLCAIDARMGEVYWAAYQMRQGVVSLAGDELVCQPLNVPVPGEGDWQALGNGWEVYAEDLLNKVPAKLDMKNADMLPRAEDVALLAEQAVRLGETVSAEQALPVYLRDKVAEKKQTIKIEAYCGDSKQCN